MEPTRYSDLADYIIAYCNLNNIEISNKKLQKLVYYCQAWTLALKKERLIEHAFEAWVHGAVLRPLYFSYSRYGHNNIVMEHEFTALTVDRFSKSVTDEQLKMIHKVLSVYAHYSADELGGINHSEYPWLKTREGLRKNEHCNKPIPDDLIKEYYGVKALERGMKEVKNNIFNFSSAGLKKAQENLKSKEVFKINDENYKEYEKFILDSYEATVETTKRSEYGKNL